MNLYDKKLVKCSKCGKTIGEVEMEVKVVCVVCDKCKIENKQKDVSYDFLNKRMIETTLS